eukprot:4137095-Amphidinium_carterae.1
MKELRNAARRPSNQSVRLLHKQEHMVLPLKQILQRLSDNVFNAVVRQLVCEDTTQLHLVRIEAGQKSFVLVALDPRTDRLADQASPRFSLDKFGNSDQAPYCSTGTESVPNTLTDDLSTLISMSKLARSEAVYSMTPESKDGEVVMKITSSAYARTRDTGHRVHKYLLAARITGGSAEASATGTSRC